MKILYIVTGKDKNWTSYKRELYQIFDCKRDAMDYIKRKEKEDKEIDYIIEECLYDEHYKMRKIEI